MKQTLLLFLFSLSVMAQKTSFEFESKQLGNTRTLTIGLPASLEKNPNKKYPLLILLDGDYLFDPFYGSLSYGAYWDDIPECIVVGINQNTDEERYADCEFDAETGLPSNQSAKFYNFIATELVPFLEKKYPVAPFRILAGHDLTAGFINYYLYQDQSMFDGYVALGTEFAPEMETKMATALSKVKKPLFYYHSNGEGDTKKIQTPIKELDSQLKQISNPNLHYKFDNFSGASHYSLVLYSIPSALYHFFDTYKPISSTEYSEKIAVLTSGYADYLQNKYDVLQKTLGIKTPVRLNDFKAIEAAILKNKAYPELEQLAQMSNRDYPKSMLAEYQLGLMYEKTGDTKRAAKKYQNASQLDEIGDLTKDMMIEKYEDMVSQTPKK